MKKAILTLVFLGLSLQAAHAQWWGNEEVNGNGDYISESRTVPDYDQVALQGSMEVVLIAGKEGELSVEAESNLMEHILTEVSGKHLKISVEKGINLDASRDKEIRITVPFETLDAVSLTGSGDINSTASIDSEEFEVDLTGSGDINLDLQAKEVKGKITGSGDINLEGSTVNLECTVTGSGDFEASNLKAEKVEARVSGSGDIAVHASKELKTRVTGSGDITYGGNPEKENFRTTGSGSVSKR